MSVTRFDSLLRPLKPGDRLREAINAERLNALTELARDAAMGKMLRGGPGCLLSTGPQGVSVRTRKPIRAPVTIHPFWIYDDTGEMHAGTVNGHIPRLGAGIIGEGQEILTLTGDFYVYIRVTFDLTFSYDFLQTYAIQGSGETLAVEVITAGTPQTDTADFEENEFRTYRLVAQVVDGIPQRQQPTNTSMTVLLCDLSTGTPEGKSVQAQWVQA